jgi:phage-related protein
VFQQRAHAQIIGQVPDIRSKKHVLTFMSKWVYFGSECCYYTSATGRSEPQDFIARLAEPFRGSIRADIHTLAEHGDNAPVSRKPVKGCSPMRQLTTGGYRTFYYIADNTVVVLHVCKKQDQKHGIQLAYRRMKELR